MKTRLVRIGNSQGIRIPKPLIEQVGLSEEVDLFVEDSCIVIKPAQHPRAGWEDSFRKMAERGDDQLLNPELVSNTEWDEDEWEW